MRDQNPGKCKDAHLYVALCCIVAIIGLCEV